MRRLLLALLIFIVAVAGGIVIARVTSRPIDGISCDVSEAVTYHVHAHLAIVVDGKAVAGPPANTGIHLEHLCLYWLHTHDSTGIIHIEAPHRISPTLGTFFDIWGQPLDRNQAGPVRGRVTALFNGHVFTGSPREIPLLAHAQIQLEVRRPLVVPERITFPQGL